MKGRGWEDNRCAPLQYILYQFSTYTLPVHDIYHFASKVNKLNILKVNGERKLHKDNKEVSRPPLKEEMSQFLAFFHSQWKELSHAQTRMS